jgi:putative membrane protein
LTETTITVPLDPSTGLAAERTFLAHERTMMAWVRTATTMISFGFTIYKFFQVELADRPALDRMIGPRGFALILIAIGLGSLALAFVEHRISLRLMRATYGSVVIRRSVAGLVAALVAGLGALAILFVALGR